MKNLFLCAIAIMLTGSLLAQNDYRKPASLGFGFYFNDFQSGVDIRENGLANLLRSKQLFKLNRMSPGISLHYLTGFTNHIDFAGSFGYSNSDFATDNSTFTETSGSLLEASAVLNLKLLPDKYIFTPFLTAGVGAESYQGDYYAASAPLGIGVQFNIADEAFVILNSQYRVGITEISSNHFYHGITIAGRIGPKRNAAPKPVEIPIIMDRDGDGVVDSLDACPDTVGLPALNGCPEIKQEIIEKVNLAAKNVFFATSSSKLLTKSYPALKGVAQILKDNPTFNIDVEGHTDSTGSAEMNHTLSHDRANSVKDYLVSNGIEESRTTVKGFGPDQPIAPNKTPAGRAKNRRVEMKLRNY
ncbi:MAG: OmpA family protein [Ginsengibacter sp.]